MPIEFEITNVAINKSPTGSLTIGDDYAKENTITFQIRLTGNGSVWLTLKIPVGEDGVLRQAEDANDIMLETPRTDPKPKLVDGKWSLGDYDSGVQVDGSTELSVSISDILCRASEGDSKITITATTETTPDLIETLTIKKAKPTTPPENPILYFIAEPTYLVGSGKVTLSWAVAGDEGDVTLDTPTQNNWSPPASPTTDSPSATFAYTLRVKNKQRQVTVNVLQAGWHELYPLGKPDAKGLGSFPSVIFNSAGRTDSTTGAALYAIFVRGPHRKAVLCKSADGITGWQVINEAVPDGMESSPGVHLGNRLWLICGSAVDPDQISNRICYYDLDRRSGWKEASVTGFDDGGRMGHACVVVNDTTVWVLGGLDKYHRCRNDVWSLKISQSGGDLSATQVKPTAPWSPRCMFGAVRFNVGHKDLIWVCGGVSSPNGHPVGDVWASSSGSINWQERPKNTKENQHVVADAIAAGGAALTDTLYMVMTKQLDQTTVMVATLKADAITAQEDPWGKAAYQIAANLTNRPHSIGVVAFGGRLYVRSLHRDAMYGEVIGAPMYLYVNS